MKNIPPYPKYSLYAYRQINGRQTGAFTPYCNAILVNAGEIEVMKDPWYKPRNEVFVVVLSWQENFRMIFPEDMPVVYEREARPGKGPLVFRFMHEKNMVRCSPLDVNYFLSAY